MAVEYSVITSTRDARSADLDWHRRLSGPRVEVIIVENAGRFGLGQAYNQGLEQASGEYCCFIHDDARVWTGGWLAMLTGTIVHDGYDLVGVAGTTRMPRTGGWWDAGRNFGRGAVAHWHADDTINVDQFGPAEDPQRELSPVVSLDGVLLFGRRRDFLQAPFDHQFFDGFHFYDSDLCFRWLLWHGKRLAVRHGIDVVHRAGSNFKGWAPMLNQFHYRHGGFLPLDLSDLSLWRDNLSALRHADAGSASRLTFDRRPGNVLSFAPTEGPGIIGKQADNDLFIEDPQPQASDPNRSWILLQGAGTGALIDRFLRDDARPVVVIEPEAHLVCWLLCRYHWAEPIHEGRLRFLIPMTDHPATHEVSLHEVIGSVQQKIASDGEPEWQMTGSTAWQKSFHDAVRQSATAPKATGERVRRWPRSISRQEIPVTVISPHCRIFNDLSACLQAEGCPTRLIQVPDAVADWSRTKYWHTLRQLIDQPSQVTLIRNRVFLEAVDPRLKLGIETHLPGRLVSWWWDEPTVATVLDLRDPQFRRPAFAFAREIVAKLPAGSRWLPPAARSEFTQQELMPDGRHRDWPISFVGQSRFRLLNDNLNQLANILAHHGGRTGLLLAHGINDAKSMRGFYDVLDQQHDELNAAIDRIRSAFPAMGYYLSYLFRMSKTAAFRLAAIEAIRDFPLLVFGDEGWVDSGAIARNQWGGLIAPDQLTDIYRRTTLNLNLNFMQVSSTVNPRVLDIAGSGNAVLTDVRPELTELFPEIAKRPPAFRTLEELPDRVAALLAADLGNLRLQSARHVREHHTMSMRARWILREFRLPHTDESITNVPRPAG